MTRSLAILTGPTATGKTQLAIELALRSARNGTPVEILNADSLLFYRGLDIGTAKPSMQERQGIPHHLLDLRSPDEAFTAGDFRALALSTLEEIGKRGARALIVGGTGFYLKALLYGLWDSPKADPALRTELERLTNHELHRELLQKDPDSAIRIGGNDRYRLIRAIEIIRLSGKTPTELEAAQPDTPDPRFRLWVIDRAQEELECRISLRVEQMIASGLIEETTQVRSQFPTSACLKAVGYRQVCAYLDHESPAGRKIAPGIAGLRSEIELATRKLVKQQRTWFRGEKSSRWFLLDQDRSSLEREFEELYGS